MDASCRFLIVGAGAVGLAVAERLASRGSVVVVERNSSFGMETSSRNSEVIHAGIYYPPLSLKTKLCIKGRKMLYEHCAKYKVPFLKCGKWIVSNSKSQNEELDKLHERASNLGVQTYFKSVDEIRNEEPFIRAERALVSPETGIFDSHEFMSSLERLILSKDGIILYRTRLSEVKRCSDGAFDAIVNMPSGQKYTIRAKSLINAAGLSSGELEKMLFPNSKRKLHLAKGHYYNWKLNSNTQGGSFKRLIYPVPDKHISSLGIHLTIDLGGKIKFGPDLHYCPTIDYSFSADKEAFAKAIKTYIPSISAQDLSEDYVGIRPKLQGPGEPFADFSIENRERFINMMGIESPGLTSSLAIAEYVDNLLEL